MIVLRVVLIITEVILITQLLKPHLTLVFNGECPADSDELRGTFNTGCAFIFHFIWTVYSVLVWECATNGKCSGDNYDLATERGD